MAYIGCCNKTHLKFKWQYGATRYYECAECKREHTKEVRNG